MPKQQGFGLLSMFMWLVAMIFVGILALKIVPSYFEYWALKKLVKETAAQSAADTADDAAIRSTFGNRLSINNITRVTTRDLVVERGPQGTVLKLAYSVRQPLMGPASLCLDFEIQAGGKAGQ